MKRKLFLLLALVGFAVFLLNEPINKVQAGSSAMPCSTCHNNLLDCYNDADEAYDICWVYYSSSFCASQREDSKDGCRVSHLTCLTQCDDPYPTGGGGGGSQGPERTPAQQACYDKRLTCSNGTDRSPEAQGCIDAGSTVLACCREEFNICMGYYQ